MVTLTPNEQQGLSFEAFAERQGCAYLPTEDGVFVVFENGASIQVRDPLRGMAVVGNPSEPPLDDTNELSVRRRFHYWSMREKKEVMAFVKAKDDALTALRMRGSALHSGLSPAVPAPLPEVVVRLKGGADRCALVRAKVAELEALIEKLPSTIEKQQREAKAAARRAAAIEADEALYREISQIGIELPDSMRKAPASQDLSV